MDLFNSSSAHSEVTQVDLGLWAFAARLPADSDASHPSCVSDVLKMGLLTVHIDVVFRERKHNTCLNDIASPHFLQEVFTWVEKVEFTVWQASDAPSWAHIRIAAGLSKAPTVRSRSQVPGLYLRGRARELAFLTRSQGRLLSSADHTLKTTPLGWRNCLPRISMNIFGLQRWETAVRVADVSNRSA